MSLGLITVILTKRTRNNGNEFYKLKLNDKRHSLIEEFPIFTKFNFNENVSESLYFDL